MSSSRLVSFCCNSIFFASCCWRMVSLSLRSDLRSSMSSVTLALVLARSSSRVPMVDWRASLASVDRR